VNLESAGPGTLTLVTNNTAQLLTTSNLALFAEQSYTNDPATLQALYPNLVILSVSNTFVTVPVTNFTSYFTNNPFDPVGTPPHLAFSSNITYTVQTLFHYTFGNLLRVQLTTNGYVVVPITDLTVATNHDVTTLQTIVATNFPFAQVGSSPLPQTFTRTTVTNRVSGEFFLLPNNFCDVSIIAPQLTNVISDTNFIAAVTNIFISGTNGIGTTNVQFFVQNRVDYFTNHSFVVYQIQCLSSNVSLNQGIEKITFIRRDFDSLIGQFFYPVTNEYILKSVTNSTIVPQRVRRVVTTPDILFTAQDLTVGPAQIPFVSSSVVRNIRFNTGLVGAGLAGPGTIETSPDGVNPGTLFVFNKVGPVFVNGPGPGDETTQFPFDFVWGSFDGTTNLPIVYPTGASIDNLERQVLIQVTPRYLLDASVGSPYSAQLQTVATANWQAPFTWSLNTDFPGLPPGLAIITSADTGVISGTPSQSGFFDFVIHITDGLGRTTDRAYSIKVNP